MRKLNARAEVDKQTFDAVAKEFLAAPGCRARTLWSAIFAPDFLRLLGEHLGLVLGSLAGAVALGVPLGVAAAKLRGLAQPVLLLTGLVQTIRLSRCSRS